MPGVISSNPPQKINNPSKRESAGIFPALKTGPNSERVSYEIGRKQVSKDNEL